jgi:hypothetical protein
VVQFAFYFIYHHFLILLILLESYLLGSDSSRSSLDRVEIRIEVPLRHHRGLLLLMVARILESGHMCRVGGVLDQLDLLVARRHHALRSHGVVHRLLEIVAQEAGLHKLVAALSLGVLCGLGRLLVEGV